MSPAGLASFDLKMDRVKVGFALSTTLNADQSSPLQLGDQLGDTGPGHAHVRRQPFLTWKTGLIVPGVAEEHGIGNFGADGQFGVFEDEIGDLGKAAAQDRIIRVQLQVLLLEDFSYSFHL